VEVHRAELILRFWETLLRCLTKPLGGVRLVFRQVQRSAFQVLRVVKACHVRQAQLILGKRIASRGLLPKRRQLVRFGGLILRRRRLRRRL